VVYCLFNGYDCCFESLENKISVFSVIVSFLLFNSTEGNILLNVTRQKNVSTKSINTISHYQSTFSTSLKNDQTTFHSNIILQSLITKPNSYLYNPNEDNDNEILVNRIKRDTTPFVCKGELLDLYNFVYLISLS
jgi:hypothetical protein